VRYRGAVRPPPTSAPPAEIAPFAPIDAADVPGEHAEPPSRRQLVLGGLLSVVAVAGVAWWASKQTAPELPRGAGDVALLGLGLVVYAATTTLRGWRWDTILRRAGIRHRAADAYGLTVVGYMGNAVLPLRGGELLKILLMSERSGARKATVLGAILPERLLDVSALAVLFAAVAFAGDDVPGGRAAAVAAAGGVLLALGAGFTYLRLRRAGRFAQFAQRVRPVARASRLLLTPTGFVLGGGSLLAWAGDAVVFTLCAQALDAPIGVLDGLLVVVVGAFFAIIPAGPGYVGTYDAAVLFALDTLGVTGGTAVGCLLLFRAVVFVPMTLAGLVLLVVRYGGLGTLLRAERRAVA
jgi:glycosyltransferase 2 family protein